MASLLSFSLPKPNIIKATSSPPATPTSTTLSSPEALDEKFGRKGIKFSEYNNIPFVELTVRNGSSLRLKIPDAHVTSYKPKVYWKDDGLEEILYTVPAGGTDPTKSKGGIGLVINDATEKSSKGSLLSGYEWTVKDADNDAIDALQVELSCTAGTLDINYVVSLYPLSIATAVIVKNNGRKDVSLTSAILSHLNFKKRSQTAINGLQGCSYCLQPPLSSPFELLSPSEAMKTESSGWFGSDNEDKPGVWTKQDVPFAMLKDKLSRVYAAPPSERQKPFFETPPSNYETLDQGRELFFRIIRMGFEDIYLSSPGSLAEKYGKDYFICTGPASMLVPVVIKPGENWRGAQHNNIRREFSLPYVASVPYQPINVEYLEGEFSGHWVSFEGIGDNCVAKMGLDSGSRATLMLPSGLITSYKVLMWHGGTVELLHTSVSGDVEGIIPPDLDEENDSDIGQPWGQMGLKRFFSGLGQSNQHDASEEAIEGEEDDGYKQLNEKMSRIYTSAPRFFALIDRGRRNSVAVGRDGFDEMYLFSPGSGHDIYGEYSFICVGHSAMLKPISLGPREVWRG
ncbi:hypothetical protein V6N12_034887 [Hibiscus sabdariffa]|uniref:Uncharacterized protein n=1 Tax=Hibiscus sabdariffa TaxID=183260 RepID=A0ABR2BNR7_9ROSI